MRAIVLIGTLALMAACAEPPYQEPAPMGGSSGSGAAYTPPPQAEPCDRANYPAGADGDAAFANCVIQN